MATPAEEMRKLAHRYEKYLSLFGKYVHAVGLCPEPGNPILTRYPKAMFGNTAFVRFDWDAEYGYISYGVVENEGEPLRQRDSIRFALAFDASSNVFEMPNGVRAANANYAIEIAGEIPRLHDTCLLRLAKEILVAPTIDSK